VDKSKVEYNDTVTLTWTVDGYATSGRISSALAGSHDFTTSGAGKTNPIISDPTTFMLTVENAIGSNTCSAAVNLKEMIWALPVGASYASQWERVVEFDRYADGCTYGKDGKCYKVISGWWERDINHCPPCYYFHSLLMCDNYPYTLGRGTYVLEPKVDGKRLSIDKRAISNYCVNCVGNKKGAAFYGISSAGTYEDVITDVYSCNSGETGSFERLVTDICCGSCYIFVKLEVSKTPPTSI